MSARDKVFGRRGGGWVPSGVVPGTGVEDLARLRAEREAADVVEVSDDQLALFDVDEPA